MALKSGLRLNGNQVHMLETLHLGGDILSLFGVLGLKKGA